jgi:hypothetical protein
VGAEAKAKEGDVFLAFQNGERLAPLTQARSTLIVSAIQTLRARGLFERYQAQLDAATRGQIGELIAGQWISVDLAVRHYRAADGLGLDVPTIESIGAEVAQRTSKTSLYTAVKMSKALGVTPWTALGLAHRLRETSWRGSDLAIYRLGPKEARYDWIGQPCAAIPYFVRSFNGFMRALLELFCTKAYTHPVAARCNPTTLSVRISWA